MRLPIALAALLPLFGACSAGEVGGVEGEDATDAELRLCAPGATVPGVDVSYYQGTIDWAAVKRSGRAFAFIRVSDGSTFRDPKFDRNYAGAQQNDLYRGVYQYFRASQDPIAQAELLLDAVGALGEKDLPPALDIETLDGMRGSTVAARAKQWADHVEAALGKRPLIYIGAGFADEINNPAALAAFPLWVANWKAACPRMPSAWNALGWTFWQTRVGSGVPGIRGSVDLDVWNGTIDQLAAYAGPAR
jgi:lysozyme